MSWPEVALAEVGTIARTIVEPDRIPDGTLYVGLEHVTRGGMFRGIRRVNRGDIASAKFAFNESHVLFGKLRPNLAKIARPTFSGVCSTDILPIAPGPRLHRGYLAHFLARPDTVALASQRAAGANLPRLSPVELLRFRIPLPPLDEQQRIARVLDDADALRAKRQQAANWAARLPQSLLAQASSMLPNELSDTCALESLVAQGDRINYGVVQPGDHVDGGVPLIRAGDLIGGKVRRDRLKSVDPSVDVSHRRSRITGNEILVSCVGSIGVVAMTTPGDIGSNIVRAIARVPIASPRLRTYVAAYLGTPRVQRYFTAELRTVAQPTLNIKQIRALEVPVPTEVWLESFAMQMVTINRLLERQLAHLGALNALFASLQHRAFAGTL